LKTEAVDDPSGEDRGCKFRHEKKPHHKTNGSNTDGEAPSGLQVDHPPLIQDLPATEVAQAGHATKTDGGNEAQAPEIRHDHQ